MRPHYNLLIKEAVRRNQETKWHQEMSAEELVKAVLDIEREGWVPIVPPELQKAREKYAELYPVIGHEAIIGAFDDRDTMQLLVKMIKRGDF